MALEIGKAQEKKAFPRIGEGTFPARMVQVIDLGKQVKTDWQTQQPVLNDDGEEIIQNVVFITFELPTETVTIDDEEKPRWLGKEYTLSWHPKSNLTSVVEALKSTQKDAESLTDLLGAPCMVQVGTTSGGKDKITNVSPPMKGFAVPELENPTKALDLDQGDTETFESLPQFIKDKITNGVNFSETRLSEVLNGGNLVESSVEDDIPF